MSAALFFRLKQKAFKECDDKAKAYAGWLMSDAVATGCWSPGNMTDVAAHADCCRGRILSVAWACRTEAKVLSSCMTQ